MLRQLRIAIAMVVFFTVLTGVLYPLALAAPARLFFAGQAEGSVIDRDGKPVGSALLGQSFVNADTDHVLTGYFRGRPSAASVADDHTLVSSGSNLGPTNQALLDRVSATAAAIREENGLAADQPIPVDLVTASGSGLDPDISPAAAALQVARVARERGMSEDAVRQLVASNTAGALLGFLGEPRVNVLQLNLALDAAAPLKVAAPAA